jgi:hypothetical protein
VGLIAGVLEEEGVQTVCLSTFDAIMKKVRPPRWLEVPYPLGFPLGDASDPPLQKRILRRALGLLEAEGPGPVMEELDPGDEG